MKARAKLVHSSSSLLKTGVDIGRWVYLGESPSKLRSMKRMLGEDGWQSIQNDLNRISLEKRNNYAEWIYNLGSSHRNSIAWWSSELHEKNTDTSTLYLNLCYLILIEDLLKQPDAPNYIIVEDWGVLLTAAKMWPQYLESYSSFNSIKIRGWSLEIFSFIARWLVGCFRLMMFWWAAWSTRAIGQQPNLAAEGKRILFHTCVDEGCFDADSGFHDRYFTRLPGHLSASGYDVVTIIWFFNLRGSVKKAFRRARNCKQQFLFIEDFFSIGRLLGASRILLKQLFLPAIAVPFSGIDTSLLLKRERVRQCTRVELIRFLVADKMFADLQCDGFKFDVFVDMFENMYNEKPLSLAIRSNYPTVKQFGFQHASITPLMLKYTFASGEVEENPDWFPDYVVCNGGFFKNVLIENGFPSNQLLDGVALRFLYLESDKFSANKTGDRDIVLVVLPMTIGMAAELLSQLLDALANLQVSVGIKTHPFSSRSDILTCAHLDKLPDSFFWCDGNMDEWLPRACCVVGVGTAAVLESICAGVPVVLIGQEGQLELNPLGWWQQTYSMFKPIYDNSKIAEAISGWESMAAQERDRITDEARQGVIGSFMAWNSSIADSFLRDHFSADQD